MTFKTHPIAVALLEHVELSRTDHGNEQEFLYDLVYSLDKQMVDEVWETLDSEVHAWYSIARENYNDDQLIINLDLKTPEGTSDDGVRDARSTLQEKPKQEKKKISAGVRIKQLMTDRNMEVTVYQLIELLRDDGYKVSKMTVETSSAEFRQSVRVLKSKGFLTGFGDSL